MKRVGWIRERLCYRPAGAAPTTGEIHVSQVKEESHAGDKGGELLAATWWMEMLNATTLTRGEAPIELDLLSLGCLSL